MRWLLQLQQACSIAEQICELIGKTTCSVRIMQLLWALCSRVLRAFSSTVLHCTAFFAPRWSTNEAGRSHGPPFSAAETSR